MAKSKHPVATAPTTSGSLCVDANGSREALFLQNFGTVRVYFGKDSGVTSANAFCYLEPGGVLSDDSTDDWWHVAASGTGDIRGFEVF